MFGYTIIKESELTSLRNELQVAINERNVLLENLNATTSVVKALEEKVAELESNKNLAPTNEKSILLEDVGGELREVPTPKKKVTKSSGKSKSSKPRRRVVHKNDTEK